MNQSNGRSYSIAGMIAGGFVIGAGLFGLYRGMNAEPLPELPPLPPISADPVQLPASGLPALPALPTPTLPSTLPGLEPAGGVVPPVVPPVLNRQGPSKPPAGLVEKSEPLPIKPMMPSLNDLPSPTSVLPPVSPSLPPSVDVAPNQTAPAPRPTLPAISPPNMAELIPSKPAVDSVPLPSPNLEPLPPMSSSISSIPVNRPLEPVGKLPALPTEMKPHDADKPNLPVPNVKPDFSLRPEQPGLNVNRRGTEPGNQELPLPVEVKRESIPAPRKLGDEVIAAPRLFVEQTSPTPPLNTTTGDTTMPMPTKKAITSAAVGAALAVSPMNTTPLASAEEPKTAVAPDAKTIEAMQLKIDDLVKDVKLLKEKKDQLEVQLFGRTDGRGTLTPTDMGVLKRLEKAEADLKKTTDLVNDLSTKLTAQSTTAEKKTLSTIPAGKGKVVLVNEFRNKLSIVLNGRSYPLDINETKEVLVSEGEFTYELVEFPNSSVVKSTIKDAETVTLRIK
jgi:hypothetical protein